MFRHLILSPFLSNVRHSGLESTQFNFNLISDFTIIFQIINLQISKTSKSRYSNSLILHFDEIFSLKILKLDGFSRNFSEAKG